MVPSESDDVYEGVIGNDGALSTHVLDDAIGVRGGPNDDRGGDEAQA